MNRLAIFILLLLGLGYFIYQQDLIAKFQEYITLKHMIRLSSSAFIDNGLIPSVYTCDGMAVNPPLEIADVPGNTQSLALIVEDPDAPGGTFTHWVVYNIPANTTTIPEKGVPANAMQGLSSTGETEYVAPCPPTGTHRYIFTLYALDGTVNLPDGADKAEVLDAIKNHIVDKTTLMGRYAKHP
ncbi:MAG TPA: YbhB/YbcL family Raf kinase inhibitor-like protein [Candidatus Eisenbacteria bacterium]|nr:YbhB/YbcL family Raf kinase inhibitor-like protein [Candidatus Eisenbacteria bacterium]